MYLTTKQKTIKYVCYCLILIAADLLQNTQGLFPQIFGARCFLLLPLAITIAMGEEIIAASFLGLFAGLLWDITAPVHLGFNCIFIAVVCFLSSALATYIVRDIFVTNMICCAVVTVLYCLLYWLFFIVIRGVDGGEYTLYSFYLPCAVYTFVISPLIWLIMRPVKRKLNFEKSVEI